MKNFNWQHGLLFVLAVIVSTVLYISKTEAKEPSFTDNLTYSIDAGYSQYRYSWYGIDQSTFTMNLYTVGLRAKHTSGFWIRYAYGQAERVTADKGDVHHNNFWIGLDNYQEYELGYSLNLTNNFDIYAGIGHYQQYVPIYQNGINVKDDSDDDEGYFTGITYRFNPKLSTNIYYKLTSCIRACDGKYNPYVPVGSAMRQYGINLEYLF